MPSGPGDAPQTAATRAGHPATMPPGTSPSSTYLVRLGPMAWALRFLAVPPPPTWLRSSAVRTWRVPDPRDGANAAALSAAAFPAASVVAGVAGVAARMRAEAAAAGVARSATDATAARVVEFVYAPTTALRARLAAFPRGAAEGSTSATSPRHAEATTPAEDDGWEAIDPETGEQNRIGWRADDVLVARRDGEPWAVVEPIAAGGVGAPPSSPSPPPSHAPAAAAAATAPRGAAPAPPSSAPCFGGAWRAWLSDRRPRVTTHAFFELLMPFLAAGEAAARGGFPFHGNALLMPGAARTRRGVVVVSGHSGAGKSTLSRWVCRTQPGWELLAEDRLIVLPRPGFGSAEATAPSGDVGGGYCVTAWPTAGEAWLRSERNAGAENDLRGIVFVGHGNANRWEGGSAADDFPLLWEQGLTALVPRRLRGNVVDTLVSLAASRMARKYRFLPGRDAAATFRRSWATAPDLSCVRRS